jgi:hypothetical protein
MRAHRTMAEVARRGLLVSSTLMRTMLARP